MEKQWGFTDTETEEKNEKVLKLFEDFDYKYALKELYENNEIEAKKYVDRNPGLKKRREQEYSIYKYGFENNKELTQ